jgi:hypothetical protein
MITQHNPTANKVCDNLAQVRVFFQVGIPAIDDYGYDVIDSINGEAIVPAGDAAGALAAHVAQHYPGWELIDWVEAGKPFAEF